MRRITLALAALTLSACGWSTEPGGPATTDLSPSITGTFGHDSGMPVEDSGSSRADAAGDSDSALPDASISSIETFALVANGSAVQPLSCPSAHWEFSGLPGTVTLKNTGSVPLAYIAEQAGWDIGAEYTPGVPTGTGGELVGVLAPGAELTLASRPGGYEQTALVGSRLPFSDDNAGFAAADEGTVPWPQGVSGSGGEMTMHVAEIDAVSACGPVTRP